jgi:hypothetical protein
MTVQERIEQLKAVPEVLDAWIDRTPASIPRAGELYIGRLAWAYLSSGVVRLDGHDIIIVKLGVVGEEAAYWLNQVPDILKPATPDAYITGRTSAAAANPKRPFTSAEVQSFCNAQWRLTSGNAAALDIKDFAVTNFDGNTVRVSGFFHDVATNTRPRLNYFITLVDPNGATTGANVKFEKVIE